MNAKPGSFRAETLTSAHQKEQQKFCYVFHENLQRFT